MNGKSKNGWVEHEDGWWKEGPGRGNADYFNKPFPPVRDGDGRPLRRDGGGIDWDKWAEEIEQGKWTKR